MEKHLTIHTNMKEHAFYLDTEDSRYEAHGTYDARDVYSVVHAPNQRDFDEIAAALDDDNFTNITII